MLYIEIIGFLSIPREGSENTTAALGKMAAHSKEGTGTYTVLTTWTQLSQSQISVDKNWFSK